ncbi:MAG: succinyl-diaminopimelate desuccinylase [Paracoccaceae bacterium]
MTVPDPVTLTQELIRCPSVTPEEAGALGLIEGLLVGAGFRCTRIPRGGVENLYARWGTTEPVFGFAGHVDVVPVGDAGAWTVDPFGGLKARGRIWGRGACDMKSGVAAFVSAAIAHAQAGEVGSVALLLTADEEGPATDGTRAILDWMGEAGECLDFCLVGEPTSVERLGDVVKIGRRGSMSAALTVFGAQGHTAYPDRAINPLPVLARVCDRLDATPLDLGSTHFPASTVALTSIDTGNTATNVIPAAATARFNIRFNDRHTSETVKIWADQVIEEVLKNTGCTAEIDWEVSGESFLTAPGPLTEIVVDAITDRMLERPALTTGGGTSDARFIKDHCPVMEVGLVGDSMHQVDESVSEDDIRMLATLYGEILKRFFGA